MVQGTTSIAVALMGENPYKMYITFTGDTGTMFSQNAVNISNFTVTIDYTNTVELFTDFQLPS